MSKQKVLVQLESTLIKDLDAYAKKVENILGIGVTRSDAIRMLLLYGVKLDISTIFSGKKENMPHFPYGPPPPISGK